MKVQEIIRKGLISQKGLIDKRIIEILQSSQSSSLLELLQAPILIENLRQVRRKSRIVSLKLSNILKISQQELEQNLVTNKKTDRTKFLTKILFSDIKNRNKIESIRLNVLQNLRNNQLSNKAEYQILQEVYGLLNYGVSSISVIQNQTQLLESKKILKQQLISLKKMMGSSIELEEDEKKNKKKAYNQNLEFRSVIKYASMRAQDTQLRQKIQKLLKLPKNKYWFGRNFYKILISQNWELPEMLLLSAKLKDLCKQKYLQGVSVIKIRPALRQAWLQIENYAIRDNEQLGTDVDKMVEQKEQRQNNLQLESLSLQNGTFIGCSKNSPISLFQSLLMQMN